MCEEREPVVPENEFCQPHAFIMTYVYNVRYVSRFPCIRFEPLSHAAAYH